MILQTRALERFCDYLSTLYVDHRYYLNSEHPEPIPESLLRSKDIRSPAIFVAVINNEEIKSFYSRVDDLIQNLKEEVKINSSLFIIKDELHSYFQNLMLTLDSILDKANKDIKNANNQFILLKLNEDFEKYNLLEYFNISLDDILNLLINRIVQFELFLLSLDEYRACRGKSIKSTSGNSRIEWNKKLNQLVDFYLNMLEEGIIETDKNNLKLFLINNFTWNGKPLSENSINTLFDPNKAEEKLPKEDKKIDPSDFLKH